jgi:hypothetical protein
VFETVTVARYIDRKSKKQESGQMRIILHAGANKTDDDRLLLSLRRNLNLHFHCPSNIAVHCVSG